MVDFWVESQPLSWETGFGGYVYRTFSKEGLSSDLYHKKSQRPEGAWYSRGRKNVDLVKLAPYKWRRAGLNPQVCLRLLEENKVCQICGDLPTSKRPLVIDHNHSTGKIRGVLCINCNRALERLDEVPDWTEKATTYLKGVARL